MSAERNAPRITKKAKSKSSISEAEKLRKKYLNFFAAAATAVIALKT